MVVSCDHTSSRADLFVTLTAETPRVATLGIPRAAFTDRFSVKFALFFQPILQTGPLEGSSGSSRTRWRK